MAEAGAGAGAGHRAGERAVKNTTVRAVGEIVGKLSTFALFAVLARSVGEEGVGAFVFALALLGIVMMPIGLGSDPYLLREVARDRRAVGRLFFDVLGLKLTLVVPVLALTFAAVALLGYDDQTRDTVYLLSLGLFLDLLAKTFHGVFNGTERGDLLTAALVVQRVFTAAVGIAALAAGNGVVTVAGVYSAGSAIGLALCAALMARVIGLPPRRLSPRRWRGLAVTTLPYGAQDVFGVLLFKLDAVILSLLATEAAVGRYGAAYRLLESTLFVSWALNGAFAAMYAKLGHDTVPSIRSVFQRSVKLALVVLVPVAVAMAVLAEPLMELLFGAEFADAAGPLRLLAPIVVLLSIVTLSSSLVISRAGPRAILRISGSMVALNVVLNLVLIPPFEASGAAAAMLVTELAFGALALRIAARQSGGLELRSMTAAVGLGGAAMLGTMLLLRGVPVAALAAGLAVYAVVFLILERSISPRDLDFARTLLRRRLRSRAAT